MKKYIPLIIIPIFFIVYLSVRQRPASDADVRAAVVAVNGRMELCLATDTDTIVVETRAIDQQGVWVERHWWWPSQGGRVLTVQLTDTTAQYAEKATADSKDWTAWLQAVQSSLDNVAEQKAEERRELEYYLRSHGVQDEGYTRIAEYAYQTDSLVDSLKRMKARYAAFGLPGQARWVCRYGVAVTWWDEDGQRQTTPCAPLVTAPATQPATMILQTALHKRPKGAYGVRHQYWGKDNPDVVYTATVVPADSTLPRRVLVAKGKRTKDGKLSIPEIFARKGAAMFSGGGKFLGVIN